MNTERIKSKLNKFALIGAFVIVVALALFLCYPLLLILALNALFPALSIPYSFVSYLAVCVLNFNFFLPFLISKV